MNCLTLVPAPPDARITDVMLNPGDRWFELPLRTDADTVMETSRRIWGQPGRDQGSGEPLWRLRGHLTGVLREFPIYICASCGVSFILLPAHGALEEEKGEIIADAVDGLFGTDPKQSALPVGD